MIIKSRKRCRRRRSSSLMGASGVTLLPRLTDFLKSGRHVVRFLEQCHAEALPQEEVARLDPEERSFFNLNTPEELKQAAAWLAAGGPGFSPSS